MKRAWSTKLRKLICGLCAVCVCIAICYSIRGSLLRATGRWLDVGERPRRTKYAMVLNGDQDTRPFVAAALANAGLAERVLVPQTIHSIDSPWPPEHDVTREILLRRHVSEERIMLIGEPCANTFDEANALAAFLNTVPATSVTVVTNDYHSRRTRWIFQIVIASKGDDLCFVTAPTDHFSADNWWLVEDGFVIYVTEYLKLFAYWLQYGNGLWWFGGAALLTAATCGWRAVTPFHSRRRLRMNSAKIGEAHEFSPRLQSE